MTVAGRAGTELGRQMKALVVEDDLKSQCLLAKVLAEGAHEVTTFENAEQAILEYQKEFYPLLFVDVGLPGMDGLQYCRWIRSQPRGEGTYVIAAIDPDVPHQVQQVLEAGANDFLTKPYQLDQLRARLKIGERQMAQFFEQQQLEQNLRNETQRWTLSNAALLHAQQEYEAALAAKEIELVQLRDELRAVVENREMEASLETAVARQDEDLDRLREEIGGLWDRCGQLEGALDESRLECEAAKARVREAEQALERAQLEAAKLRQVGVDSVESVRETLTNREEELARLEQELVEARDELARRLREHTEQWVGLSDQMRLSLEERKRVESELAAAHDELVRRGREQVDESLRRAEEFRELLEERRRLERVLEAREDEREAEQKRLVAARDEMERRLAEEAGEASRLKFALAQAEERACALEQERESMAEELGIHRDARKRIESRWRVMMRLGTQLNRAQTAEEVARVAGRATDELVGWELFSVDGYLAEGDWIHPILSLECAGGESGIARPIHSGSQPNSLMRRVLEDGPQLIVRPASAGSRTEVSVMNHRTRRSVSLVCVPITTDDRVVGFLSIRSGGENAYRVEDLETLEMVAAQCAGALERIELASARQDHEIAEPRMGAGLAVPAGT
jgi:DNA-binding response OmpR family regulator